MRLLIILLILLPINCFAGMTCTETATSIGGGKWLLSVLMEFDATPTTATCTLSGEVMDTINRGLYIYDFNSVPGTTGPTINSDIAIVDAKTVSIVSASGNGANVIDNSTNNKFYGDGSIAGSTNLYPMGDGSAWTITITNNAVSNSTATLYMHGFE